MIKKIALAVALIGIILYGLNGTRPDADAFAAQLRRTRGEKNRAFRTSPTSPLPAAQRAQFDSLNYYPANLAFEVTATVERHAETDTVVMQMSGNRTEKYLHWGEVAFTVDGQPQRLGAYLKASGVDSTLFIPFTDLTNGRGSYGGGRYLDAPIPKVNEPQIKLDFNRAYNPYCAYDNEFSCPVPPADNRLQVAIAAGEKSFHD